MLFVTNLFRLHLSLFRKPLELGPVARRTSHVTIVATFGLLPPATTSGRREGLEAELITSPMI